MRIAIVEDENEAARQLEECLQRYGREVSEEFEIQLFTDAGRFLDAYQPQYDMVFMDIKMPGIDGMTAARRLRELDSVVTLIFVTSMVQYAVTEYEVSALDFIVKPVRYPSFQMKMRRAFRAAQMRRGQEVLINTGGVTRVLPAADIYYVEVMDHNLTYHTRQGPITVRGKLGAVEQQLPAALFFRCSASYLINLRHVTSIAGDTVTVGEWELRVSRGRKKALMEAVASYLGRGV